LSAKGISWAWFAGGWDNAAGYTDGPGWTNGGGPTCGKGALANSTFPYCPDPLFQFHHQPFNYYDKYKATPDGAGHETNPLRLEHLRDEKDFLTAAHNGTMPAVSFVKPVGNENEHPGYTGLHQGDTHLVELIGAIQASPQWKSTMVVVTYDKPPVGAGQAKVRTSSSTAAASAPVATRVVSDGRIRRAARRQKSSAGPVTVVAAGPSGVKSQVAPSGAVRARATGPDRVCPARVKA
jgi:hypothetical protein